MPSQARLLLVILDLLRGPRIGQRGLRLASVQPGLGGHRGQAGRIEDRPPRTEVGAVQRVDHGWAVPVGLGILQQPVRGPGVAQLPVHGEVQPGLLGQALHPALSRRGLRRGHAVPGRQHVQHGLGGPGGPRRVQLERVVDDLDFVAVLEPAQRGVKTRLAQIAPGADDVGPDVHAHVLSPGVGGVRGSAGPARPGPAGRAASGLVRSAAARPRPSSRRRPAARPSGPTRHRPGPAHGPPTPAAADPRARRPAAGRPRPGS